VFAPDTHETTELGYQFILWRRVALDFVLMGPGIAYYSASASLDSDIDPEIKSEIKLIIEERWNFESAAFKSRAKKLLKDL
jgi:hypothetical protein